MRIVTWNMQGNVNAVYINQLIQASNADVLCLQETGNLAHQLQQGANPIPGFPGSLRGIFLAGQIPYECVYWHNPGWGQGGVAVMTRLQVNNWGIMAPVLAPYNPANPRNLPWIEVVDPHNPGPGITVYSIHSPPVWAPVTLADVLSWNNAQIGAAAVAGNWAVVGDFNADPVAPGFVNPPVGAVVHGNHATQQGGGLLDYAVTNAPGFVFVEADELLGASDHYPQTFTC